MNISETSITQEADVEKLGESHDWGSNHGLWDEQHSSTDTLLKGTSDNEARRQRQRDGSGVGKMLVVLNFILQLLSVVIGLLNSNPRPLYSLTLVLLSFASFVLWIIELVHRWKREKDAWKWSGKPIPLLYSSSTNKSFFQGVDIVGLPSALSMFIVTAVNFHPLARHANTQIQINLWPIVAASFLLCSKFWADRTNNDARNPASLDSIKIENPGSEGQDSSPILQVRKNQWYSQVCKNQWCSQITIEWVFAIVNFILEIPSAVLDQLSSSAPKPQYALILMLLSLCSSILCIFELLCKGKTERVTWSWKWISVKVPWPYPNKPFFSFWDKVGLISAMVQLVLTTVNYVLVVQRRGQVPICVFPIVFGLVRSFPPKSYYDSPNKTEGEGNDNKEAEGAPISQRQTETTHPNLRRRARKVSVLKEINLSTGKAAKTAELDELATAFRSMILKHHAAQTEFEAKKLLLEINNREKKNMLWIEPRRPSSAWPKPGKKCFHSSKRLRRLRGH